MLDLGLNQVFNTETQKKKTNLKKNRFKVSAQQKASINKNTYFFSISLIITSNKLFKYTKK